MATSTGTLLGYVETKTQAGTGTLNNTTTGIPLLNEAMLDYRAELIKRGVDAAQTQESYANGAYSTVGQINYSTFSWPSDMYVLKTIEVNMTDGTPQNYIQAQAVDAANTPGQSSYDYLRVNQSKNSPMFDDRGDTYEIFPSFAQATNTSNAIRIIYYLTPTTYVATSDNLAYPDTLDWYALADRVSALYYESLGKFDQADYWRKRSDDRIERLVTTLARGSSQPIEPTPLTVTGWEF